MKKTDLRILLFAVAPLVILVILGLDYVYPDVQRAYQAQAGGAIDLVNPVAARAGAFLSPAVPPKNPTPKDREVLGFYTEPEPPLPGSRQTLVARADSLDVIAPFWFQLDPSGNGNLVTFGDATPGEMRLTVDLAHEKGVKVLALFHNLLYGREADGWEVARIALGVPENRSRLVGEVQRLIEDYGFDGVNVDIEAFYEGDGELLETFLDELAATIRPRGNLLTVSIPAKTDDEGNAWSAPFNYRRIGQIADRVAIMTYDEHGYSSGPGPVASIGWVEDVVRYAITRIPRDKLLLGIPAYGFDWTEGRKHPRYLSYKLAVDTAERAGVSIGWDEKAKVPRFAYRDERGRHEVWFEDARSWQAKIDLVNEYDLAGIAIWRLGMEDPVGWEAIRSRMAPNQDRARSTL